MAKFLTGGTSTLTKSASRAPSQAACWDVLVNEVLFPLLRLLVTASNDTLRLRVQQETMLSSRRLRLQVESSSFRSVSKPGKSRPHHDAAVASARVPSGNRSLNRRPATWLTKVSRAEKLKPSTMFGFFPQSPRAQRRAPCPFPRASDRRRARDPGAPGNGAYPMTSRCAAT